MMTELQSSQTRGLRRGDGLGSCDGCLTSWAIVARLRGWMKPGRTLSENLPSPAGRGPPGERVGRLCHSGGVPGHPDRQA